MKRLLPRFAFLALGAATLAAVPFVRAQTNAGSRNPIVITMPAIPDGSNRSRAPFPAERRFDDVQRPNGQAVDLNVPPNTPATDPEPRPIPPPRVAILQRTPAPTAVQPGLLPTGRTVVGLAPSLDADRIGTALRSADENARASLFADIERRMTGVRSGLDSLRLTSSQMSDAGRSRFTAAESELAAREKDLRESLQAARSATGAAWESARARVAEDFAAYAAAAGRVDAVSGAVATH